MSLEQDLAAERTAHAATKRALEAAQATIEALKTAQAHAELGQAEVVETEQRACEEMEPELNELRSQVRTNASDEPRPQPALPLARPGAATSPDISRS